MDLTRLKVKGNSFATVCVCMLVRRQHLCQAVVVLLQILSESTREAMRLGLTEKFLAEGQPETGKNGHVLAAVSHRCRDRPTLS